MTKRMIIASGLGAALTLILALSACNMPGRGGIRTATPSGFEMINTAAARTVAAQLTEISKPPAATLAPTQKPAQTTPSSSPPAQLTAVPSQPPAFTVVAQPTQAPQAGACDLARFVKDVTVPDNTVIQPGASFTKTWRLKNIGKCTWDQDYRLVFVSGESLGNTTVVGLPDSVSPDETVDVSVEMIAPTQPGTYRSEWKLSNAQGETFGSGKNGNLPIWAQIQVGAAEASSRTFDFVSSASSAAWYSAAGDSSGLSLAFNGSPDNPAGATILADGLELETGQTSGKVLLMIPKQQEDGYVYGIFTPYPVQSGNHFKARVGFAANPDGRCGVGKVIFQIAAKQGEDIDTLKEIPAACDGSLTPIDLDLSSLAGKTLEFILAVRADGSPQEDWAVWNSPQITSK